MLVLGMRARFQNRCTNSYTSAVAADNSQGRAARAPFTRADLFSYFDSIPLVGTAHTKKLHEIHGRAQNY